MKTNKPTRRSSAEKLMDARVKMNMAANVFDHSSTKALREGMDYSQFQIGPLSDSILFC